MALITDAQIVAMTNEIKTQNTILHTLVGGGSGETIASWKDLKEIVKTGLHKQIISEMEQFDIKDTVLNTVYPFDAVSFNTQHHTEDGTENSLTLLSHYTLGGYPFDAQEALIACRDGLSAGTYYFTIVSAYSSWTAGSYQFTLPQSVPADAQLVLSGQAGTALTSLKLSAYEKGSSTALFTNVAITSGSAGTFLGNDASMTATNGCYINHLQRASYGSNNYKESAIRQFINSTGYNWWSPQTIFDRPPSYVNQVGYLSHLESDFLSVLGLTYVHCHANDVYESPDSTVAKSTNYQLSDKFFIASWKELSGLNPDSKNDGSQCFDAYVGSTNADRIKYRYDATSSAQYWWIRDPSPNDANYERRVKTTGTLDGGYAHYGYQLVPACVVYAS